MTLACTAHPPNPPPPQTPRAFPVDKVVLPTGGADNLVNSRSDHRDSFRYHGAGTDAEGLNHGGPGDGVLGRTVQVTRSATVHEVVGVRAYMVFRVMLPNTRFTVVPQPSSVAISLPISAARMICREPLTSVSA